MMTSTHAVIRGNIVALGLMLACMAGAGSAFADVKAGVDAWAQGDYAKAIREWTPLARSGDPDALFNMGQAYKLGRGVPADLGRALEYYRQAAEKDHHQAADNYGLLLFQQNRREEAMPYIKGSALRGEARAQYIYGIALFNGDLTAKDWPGAYAMMTRAARAGVPQATNSLEQMNRHIPEEERVKGLALAEEQTSQQTAALRPTPAAAPRNMASATQQTEPRPKTSGPRTGTKAPAAPEKPAKIAEKPAIAAKAPTKVPSAPKIAANGKWRVQIGAFAEAGGAQRMWKKLTGKVSGLSAYQHYMVKAGAITRLQAGPFANQADAAALCRRIRAVGEQCLPTAS